MSEVYDLIVIGGGVSGLGVAKAAKALGIRALLLERGQCGGGTSSNSLRIIHGGFRYFQTFNIPRVVESLRAQRELYHYYPDLVVPFPCVMPLEPSGMKSAPMVRLGIQAYRLLSKCAGVPVQLPSVLSPAEIQATVPALRDNARYGALRWWDGALLNPSELHSRLRAEIGDEQIRENVGAASVRRDGSLLTVNTTGNDSFQARSVVNAAGPWIKDLRPHMPEIPDHHGHYWAKAFNVLIRGQIDPVHGIALRSNEGRLFFAVPRVKESGERYTAIGTEYLLHEGSPDEARISDEEMDAFVAEFGAILPSGSVSPHDVIGIEMGVLPLRRSNAKALFGAAKISGERGYFEILSTKYTTFLPQGRTVMRDVKQWLDESST